MFAAGTHAHTHTSTITDYVDLTKSLPKRTILAVDVRRRRVSHALENYSSSIIKCNVRAAYTCAQNLFEFIYCKRNANRKHFETMTKAGRQKTKMKATAIQILFNSIRSIVRLK